MRTILNRRRRILYIAAALFQLVAFTASAHADIYQWEYVNPADPSQGKQQSTTLALNGADVDAEPGAYLSGLNLTMAYLIDADLRNASFYGTTLTDADFAGAQIRGANFTKYRQYVSDPPFGSGITLAQLYSTASYQAHELSGISVDLNDLGGANFTGQNLTNAVFGQADLTGANFRQANLGNARFVTSYSCQDICYPNNPHYVSATLTNADFTDANVRAASFSFGSLKLAQLYSTASYRSQDLTGIDLGYSNLADGNFTGQNLTNSGFPAANLERANFHQANLTGASFDGATLTDADFTGTQMPGASFDKIFELGIPGITGDFYLIGTGIALEQLYSTANYQTHDLSGVSFGYNELAGGNFAGQHLANVSFAGATLTGADFTNAEIRGATFGKFFEPGIPGTPYRDILIGTGITLDQLYSTVSYQERDIRGVSGVDSPIPASKNLILPDGRIQGLNLNASDLFTVRDFDGNAARIPITIDEHLAIEAGGTLRMVFEADAWDSTISFALGIPVTLGGTLELTFAPDVNLASQVGRTFDLFDWTGVNPTGTFAISSPYAWDLSNLYTTGEVTLTAVPEPAGFALAAVGAFSLTFYRKRKIA